MRSHNHTKIGVPLLQAHFLTSQTLPKLPALHDSPGGGDGLMLKEHRRSWCPCAPHSHSRGASPWLSPPHLCLVSSCPLVSLLQPSLPYAALLQQMDSDPPSGTAQADQILPGLILLQVAGNPTQCGVSKKRNLLILL